MHVCMVEFILLVNQVSVYGFHLSLLRVYTGLIALLKVIVVRSFPHELQVRYDRHLIWHLHPHVRCVHDPLEFILFKACQPKWR